MSKKTVEIELTVCEGRNISQMGFSILFPERRVVSVLLSVYTCGRSAVKYKERGKQP
ncbi:MAG TPA: hypothetical protein VNG51_12450 [Ktedonobacteraceae bacterium]|nr:hypothetical protein [Ktedonobacteraceae bacterium]